MAKSKEQIEAQIERTKQQLARLQKEKAAKERAEKAVEQKKRNHRMILMGATLERYLTSRVGVLTEEEIKGALDSYCEEHADEIAQYITEARDYTHQQTDTNNWRKYLNEEVNDYEQ